jgi:hypothetical protein
MEAVLKDERNGAYQAGRYTAEARAERQEHERSYSSFGG